MSTLSLGLRCGVYRLGPNKSRHASEHDLHGFAVAGMVFLPSVPDVNLTAVCLLLFFAIVGVDLLLVPIGRVRRGAP